MKYDGYKIIKMSTGAVISIFVASLLGLNYAASAGIITIISIQDTKRESLKIAFKRVVSVFIALFLSALLFSFIGFNSIALGLFLIIFISISTRFRIGEGIVSSTVLVLHLLFQGNINSALLFNEIMIMVIGISIALLLNLYFPSLKLKLINEQIEIENYMKEILKEMTITLEKHYISKRQEELFALLKQKLTHTQRCAYIHMNNRLFSTSTYFFDYMEMRLRQYEVLSQLKRHSEHLFMTVIQTKIISEFTKKLSDQIHKDNDGKEFLNEINEMFNRFDKMPLPITREEFINRAMLYQYMNDLEELVIIKKEFMKKYKRLHDIEKK